jgi:hypothetical protein
MPAPFVFAVELSWARGPYLGVHPAGLWLRAAGARLGEHFTSAATVLERGDDGALSARDVPLAEADARRLAELWAANESEPRVEGVVDTSDSSSRVALRVEGERPGGLDLLLASSGFAGPGVPALRAFFAELFRVLGVRSASARADLLG